MTATEFTILYTHQKTKKRKTWHDGTLTISADGKSGSLKNDEGQSLDTIRIKSGISVGDDLESAKYLIQIDDVCHSNSKKEKKESLGENSFNYKMSTVGQINPRFRTKLPRVMNGCGKENDEVLPVNPNSQKNGQESEFFSDLIGTYQQGGLEAKDKPMTNKSGVKKRKKFCVPRRVGACCENLVPISNWKEDSTEDEFSDMACVVVRQDTNGIWQTVEHNQPQGGSKHSKPQDRARRNGPPNRDQHSLNLKQGKHQFSWSEKNAGRHDGTRKGKLETKTLKNLSAPDANFQGNVARPKPIRTAKEVLDILKQARDRVKSEQNLTSNDAVIQKDPVQTTTRSSHNFARNVKESTSLTNEDRETYSGEIMDKKNTCEGQPAVIKSKGSTESDPLIQNWDSDSNTRCKSGVITGIKRDMPPRNSELLVEKTNPVFFIDDYDFGQDFCPNFALGVDF